MANSTSQALVDHFFSEENWDLGRNFNVQLRWEHVKVEVDPQAQLETQQSTRW